jgi:hypothetical protein
MDFLPPLSNGEYYTIQVRKNRQGAIGTDGGGGSFFWILLLFFFLFVIFLDKNEEATAKPANTERVSQTSPRTR